MSSHFESDLRRGTVSHVQRILERAGFEANEELITGVIVLTDSLCNYTEEGRKLFPQILLTDNIDAIARTLPFCKCVRLETTGITEFGFRAALKEGAPLATGGWCIFLETARDKMAYGLVSIESSMLSASLDQTLLSNFTQDFDFKLVFIRSAGERQVQLKTFGDSAIVNFSLKQLQAAFEQPIATLLDNLVVHVDEAIASPTRNVLSRILDMALPFSHGNLIGVIDNRLRSATEIEAEAHQIWERQGQPQGQSVNHWLEASKSRLDRIREIATGMFLNEAVDFADSIKNVESPGGDAALRSYASLMRNMINNDGITIFTTDGKVVGYHVFVTAGATLVENQKGGARSRAFQAMCNCSLFNCCFFKSQDGNMKVFETSI
jgi:hypothetical protein